MMSESSAPPPGAAGATDLASSHRLRADVRLPNAGDMLGGKYALGRRLGEGGMGVVYEATHTRLKQRLAVKVLRPDVAKPDEARKRFEREAQATAQLRSVHAARVVDVDTLPNGLPYIVMEFLEGRDLEAELRARGAMPVEQAVDIVLQAAEAMGEAHALGIVHRDLKPSNLFVCRFAGRLVIKVLDFGISRIDGEEQSRITATGEYFGTPYYAAPEQLRSAADADARSDIWSLGIILFELLTGRPPFVGSPTAVVAKVMVDPIPWPIDLRPDLPRKLARPLKRALQRDPRKRFQTISELTEALAPFGPTLSATAAIADARRGRVRIGEMLVAEGLIWEADLQRALSEHHRSGRMLGRVLLEMGLIAHADLLTALAKQQGIERTSERAEPIDDEVRSRAAVTLGASSRRQKKSRRSRLLFAIVVVICLLGALGAVLATRPDGWPGTSRPQAVGTP